MDSFDIGEKTFKGINIPLILFNITANIFYAWSLFLDRGKLKQPLKCLLGYLVFLTVTYCLSLVAVTYSLHFIVVNVLLAILKQYTHCSMSCYVWLNFFYYVSIVPHKRAFMVWTKKNIKSIIYGALIWDSLLYVMNGTLTVTWFLISNNNQTLTEMSDEMNNAFLFFFFFIKVYLLLCMLIMMVSSFSTAHYLGKHIRNFAKSVGGLTSLKIQSQIRVTISGILQGLFFLFYYVFYLADFFIYIIHPKYMLSNRISLTAISFYLFATTVNIGISQAVIRQRAAVVFRDLKALCGVNKAK